MYVPRVAARQAFLEGRAAAARNRHALGDDVPPTHTPTQTNRQDAPTTVAYHVPTTGAAHEDGLTPAARARLHKETRLRKQREEHERALSAARQQAFADRQALLLRNNAGNVQGLPPPAEGGGAVARAPSGRGPAGVGLRANSSGGSSGYESAPTPQVCAVLN